MPETLIVRLAIALSIGFVVGVERGWRERDAPSGSRTAGVRTYALSGLLGGAVAALAQALSAPLLVGLAFAVFAAAFAWFKYHEMEHDHDYSVTGIVAALVVFVLGALAVVGDVQAAAAAGVATAGILAGREKLHGLLTRLTWPELRSALLLMAMTVIVLPMLPDRTIDPFDSLNLRQVWIFTVLTAAISYAGYVALKIAGPEKGILVSGLAGAMVSSTAVTIAFARRAAGGDPPRVLAGGALLAGMVSALRVTVLVIVVAPVLAAHLAPPMLAGAAVLGAGGWLLVRRTGPGGAEPAAELGNPFDLMPLLAFAAIFAVVVVVGGWLRGVVGGAGILATSAVMGLIDVDVASLSAARLAGSGLAAETAVLAILAASGVNAAARAAYGTAVGPRGFSLPLIAGTIVALAAAAVAAGATVGLLRI